MTRPSHIVLPVALLVACSSQAPTPPPGVTVGPGGVTAPGVSIGPGGISVPGVNIGPGGISAPGVTVGPGGITAPGVSVGPGGVTAPGVSIAVPGAPGAAPAGDTGQALGIAECDGYVQRACACSNEVARASTCAGARVSLEAWRGALAIGGDRASVTGSCTAAMTALQAACP
ncbi:MAG: hypothetical protein HYY06_23790 [Deltaproteobacteria bacterium]|nr:hypothetical protein [Deltaproteobacteria bacterium]